MPEPAMTPGVATAIAMPATAVTMSDQRTSRRRRVTRFATSANENQTVNESTAIVRPMPMPDDDASTSTAAATVARPRATSPIVSTGCSARCRTGGSGGLGIRCRTWGPGRVSASLGSRSGSDIDMIGGTSPEPGLTTLSDALRRERPTVAVAIRPSGRRIAAAWVREAGAQQRQHLAHSRLHPQPSQVVTPRGTTIDDRHRTLVPGGMAHEPQARHHRERRTEHHHDRCLVDQGEGVAHHGPNGGLAEEHHVGLEGATAVLARGHGEVGPVVHLGIAVGTQPTTWGFSACSRSWSRARSLYRRQSRQTTRSMRPCRSTTRELPAPWWSPSTFWVTMPTSPGMPTRAA